MVVVAETPAPGRPRRFLRAWPDGDLSRAEKYRDAFWRLVPIPAGVVIALASVIVHPSATGVVAVAVLGVVGALVEVVLWRKLQIRWEGGVPEESVGQLIEPDGALRLLFIVLALGTVRAIVFGLSLPVIVIAVCIYAGLFGLMVVVERRSRR